METKRVQRKLWLDHSFNASKTLKAMNKRKLGQNHLVGRKNIGVVMRAHDSSLW